MAVVADVEGARVAGLAGTDLVDRADDVDETAEVDGADVDAPAQVV